MAFRAPKLVADHCLVVLICWGGCSALWGQAQDVAPITATESGRPGGSDAVPTVDELIEQLGHPNYHLRVDAEWKLQRMGLAAFEKLRIAANSHSNIQIANTAQYIIESQNIIWWLDTDSVEVRSYLVNYSAADEDRREASILLLGRLNTPDAWMALCRLARYERHEHLSKMAALTLLEVLTEEQAASKQAASEEAAKSVLLAIGDSERPAVRWLQMFADSVIRPSDDMEPWQNLAASEGAVEADSSGRVRVLKLRFFKWLGAWLTRIADKEMALATIRPQLMALVEQTPMRLQALSVWALDQGMPELLRDFADQYADTFAQNAELSYLLAESLLKQGDEQAAEEQARLAGERAGPPQQAKALSKSYRITGLLAHNRLQLARFLESRGLFPWAEREYQLALKDDSSRYDEVIRESLAQFYWFGGQYRQAAETLKPMVDELETELEQFGKDQLRATMRASKSEVLATYYFYDGLASTQEDRPEVARQSLRKAYEHSSSNPDIVIAMKQVADTPEYEQYYRACFVQMRDEFRRLVVRAEDDLARADGRNQRRSTAAGLATGCNQLAWLLSKCEEDPQEAVQLSLRSLELDPERPIYLDTLGRCYFAAGDLESAVATQRRAVKLAPHERQMAAQLAEFEQAAQSEDAAAGDVPPTSPSAPDPS